MPAAVSTTRPPTATSIITRRTTARWIFMDSVSLTAGGKSQVGRLDSVTSTQDAARDMAIGSIVIANHQTAGRGRLERRWEAPPGTALLASFVLHPNPLLSLAAGVAAADACGESVRLKWPNDLLLAGLNLGGVLVQASAVMGVS